jgi:hypothetical protein
LVYRIRCSCIKYSCVDLLRTLRFQSNIAWQEPCYTSRLSSPPSPSPPLLSVVPLTFVLLFLFIVHVSVVFSEHSCHLVYLVRGRAVPPPPRTPLRGLLNTLGTPLTLFFLLLLQGERKERGGGRRGEKGSEEMERTVKRREEKGRESQKK